MREALRILSEKNDMSKAMIAQARLGVLAQYEQYLHSTHRKTEAQSIEAEMTQLRGEQQPSCDNCTVNVVGLSNALR